MNDTQKLQSLAPVDENITPYDREHFKLYLRLLDAEKQGVDWRTVASDIMGLSLEDVYAETCWHSHLQRARWISESGYRHLLDSPE